MAYSQHGEEVVILSCMESLGRPGRFLDIGAADGVTFSNTRALAERGWRGVCVEASPHQFVNLQRNYAGYEHVDLVCACVSLERRLLKFWDTPDFVATTEEANRRKWAVKTTFSPIHVASTTPTEILSMFPGEFHVVNIDTEGTSTALFLDLFKLPLNVWVWCVEHDGHHVEIADMGRSKGYDVRYLDGNNIILAREF